MNGSQKCYQGSTLCSCVALRTNSYKIRITHLFGCNKFFQSVQITVNHCITEAFFSDCTRAIKFNLDLHVTQRLNWNPTTQRRAHILTGRLESWDKQHQYSLFIQTAIILIVATLVLQIGSHINRFSVWL